MNNMKNSMHGRATYYKKTKRSRVSIYYGNRYLYSYTTGVKMHSFFIDDPTEIRRTLNRWLDRNHVYATFSYDYLIGLLETDAKTKDILTLLRLQQ